MLQVTVSEEEAVERSGKGSEGCFVEVEGDKEGF
jgi:hypothetical protein